MSFGQLFAELPQSFLDPGVRGPGVRRSLVLTVVEDAGDTFKLRIDDEARGRRDAAFERIEGAPALREDHLRRHERRGAQARDSHLSAVELPGKTEAESDLRELGLAVSPHALIAMREHDVVEIDRRLSE